MSDTIRVPVGPSGKRTAWALIDVEDYERVIQHSWYLNPRGYAFSPSAIDGKGVFLQGFIVGRLAVGDRKHVDHLNRDRLDNRKVNLRVVSAAENVANSELGELRASNREKAREMRLTGMRVGEVASELGMATRTVSACSRDIPRPRHPSLKWTKESVAEALSAFAVRHGRLPAQQDLNGVDGMPWFPTVYRVGFSGIVEARAAAGLEAVDLRGPGRARRKVAAA